jgi:hypothetical protein
MLAELDVARLVRVADGDAHLTRAVVRLDQDARAFRKVALLRGARSSTALPDLGVRTHMQMKRGLGAVPKPCFVYHNSADVPAVHRPHDKGDAVAEGAGPAAA